MNSTTRAGGVVVALAILFLACHLPYLPSTLEDLDSINFALGVRHFDVANHQPHPPGYPLFIAAAKGLNHLLGSEVRALSGLAVLSGALGVLALFALFRRLDAEGRAPLTILLSTALATVAPLYWVTSLRPLSDMSGLAAALSIQALTLSGASTLPLAGFLAGVGGGIRSQVVWLTVPLLVWTVFRSVPVERARLAVRTGAMLILGGLVWFVPLVVVSGGPAAYWQALSSQGTEDLTGVQMLWTTRTPRQVLVVLQSTLIAPWGGPIVAGCVLVLAVLGLSFLTLRRRSTLAALVAAFGPYLVFDVLFQESVTTRYALPLVVPMAYLAIQGAAVVPKRLGLVAAAGVVVACGFIAHSNASAYASLGAPSFRLLEDMKREAETRGRTGVVLAMHRREDLDFRRPIAWMGEAMPPVAVRLPAPPKREWLELVNYWNSGGRAPVWFVADPLRSDLALVDHRGPHGSYRWPLAFPALVGGARPNEMDWYEIDRPSWYLGEGWSLTPETAGIAAEWRRASSSAAIRGWVARRAGATTMLIGGRNLAGADAVMEITIDGRRFEQMRVAPGFFVRMLHLAPGALDGAGDYAALEIATNTDIVVEQFDAQSPDRIVVGFGEGWHEREYDPIRGRLWRWMSKRAVLLVRGTGEDQVLSLRGVTETFEKPSRVVIRAGGRIIAEQQFGSSFATDVIVPGNLLPVGEQTVVIETDQFYVPAERSSRTQDRRRLGLKVLECRLLPARERSGPSRQTQ